MKLYNMIILLSVFHLSACSTLNNQREKEENKNFIIEVARNESEILLSCSAGCDWETLSFTTKDYQPQAVNENGMTDLQRGVSDSQSAKASGFLFTIMKTTDGVKLESSYGASWDALSFSLSGNEKIMIDQNGMQ